MAYSPDHHEFNFMLEWWKQQKRNERIATIKPNENVFTPNPSVLLFRGNSSGNSSTSSTMQPGMVTTIINTHVIVIVLLCLSMTIGVLGNSLVVYFFSTKSHNRDKETKKFEFLLKILTIVHLIASVVAPTEVLYGVLTDYKMWHFGQVGCNVIPSFFQFLVTASCGILILISYKKYESKSNPFGNQNMNLKETVIWMIGIIIVSLVISIPYTMTLNVIDAPYLDAHTCLPKPDSQKLLLVSASLYLTRDAITIISIGYYQFRMYLINRKQSIVQGSSDERVKNESRRVILTITIVFLVLVVPSDIYDRVIISGELNNLDPLIATNTFFRILQLSCFVPNFFIYLIQYSDFKQFFGMRKKKDSGEDINPFNEVMITRENNKLTIKVVTYADTDVSSCSSL